MDLEGEKKIFSNISNNLIRNKNSIYLLKLFIIIIISFIIAFTLINIGIIKFSIKYLENMNIKLKNDLFNTIYNLTKSLENKNNQNEEFNENIKEEYRENQNNFCKNINEYFNFDFEKKIKLGKVIFKNITFNMFIYKKNDVVSKFISNENSWEKLCTNNIINALNYYSKKKNLLNKDIYIIDVGGNIGWYTFILGKYGYNIFTFEPSKINYYILNKSYCLNKDINITIINKGLFPIEKKCYIFSSEDNIGNGMINCDKKEYEGNINNGEIILTKLSNYIPFFRNRNLAMIKMDIEGSEGEAIESGIEFITKYHIPFIFIEFMPKLLTSYGTNPKKLLEIFINNGYKINLLNFFETKIYDIEYIIKRNRNLYIVYNSFLK